MLPQKVEAIYCTTYAPNNYSWWDCETNTDCGGGSTSFCDGGTCTFYESTGTENCYSSGSYCSSACTRTYWSYDDTCYSVSSGGGCDYGDKTSGYPYSKADDSCFTSSCDSGECSGGSCVPACDSDEGDACNRNDCGGTGVIQCNGDCSEEAPNVPADLGDSCASPENSCGETNSGTIECDGGCSASTPSNPAGYGNSCGSGDCAGNIDCDGDCDTDGDICGSDQGPSCRYSSTCDAYYYKNSCSSGSCIGSTSWTSAAANDSSCVGILCGGTGDCDIYDSCMDYDDVSKTCNLTSSCATICTDYDEVPAGTDPYDECGSLSCTSYYDGWSGDVCYYKANVADNSCEGNGTCYDAADLCPYQGPGDAAKTCGLCANAGDGCTGTTAPGDCTAASDDSDCGIIDCGDDYYFASGTASATGTNYCKLRDYTDITSNRCEGVGDCKEAADCSSPSDSTVATCGICKYATGACSTCFDYSSGADCGSSKDCNGEGSCVAVVDLIVQSITASPASPVPGQDITYTMVVKNQGTGTSTDGWLDGETADNPCDTSGEFGYISLDTINAGATATFVLVKAGGFATTGTHTIWMHADADCQVSETNEANNKLSHTITVAPPDTTSPTVTVTADPSDVTENWKTGATANITCSDASGCEGSGNWKWLTRETSIVDCSSFDLNNDYTSWGGSLAITSHVWMCATVKDNVGLRGYSSPVEFRVEKENPTSVFNPTSPVAGSWQRSNFLVFVDDADTGGSGLSACYYGVYSDSAGWTVPFGTSRATCDLVPSITVGSTGNCRNEGSNKCQVQLYSKDAAGNISDTAVRAFSIDYASPSVGNISPLAATVNTPVSLQVTVSDTGSGLDRCYLVVDGSSQGSMTISGTTASKDYTFSTLGPHTASASCWDGANNPKIGTPFTINVVAPTLSFPTGSWDRLWYYEPLSNAFSAPSYRGENTIGDINYDWVGNTLFTSPAGTPYSNLIGFKAGRTLNLTGAYTITVGADDGIKLFVNGGNNNLLPPEAWNINHSHAENIHKVRVDNITTVEIHYRENTEDAQISFSYVSGFTDTTQEFECLSGVSCIDPAGRWNGCDAHTVFEDSTEYCYYNAVAVTGCPESPAPSMCHAIGYCNYQNRCTIGANQACTNSGCVEGIPPIVTINTVSNQWYPAGNPSFDIDASDNVALDKLLYQIDSYTTDQTGTRVTSNGISNLTVSGTSSTSNWKITSVDWNNLSDGTHTIYVKTIDTSGNCTGCDVPKSFTVKKDSLSPSSILNVASAATGTDPEGRHWFNIGKSISITDKDNETPGVGKYSGIDNDECSYSVKDLGANIYTVPFVQGNRTCGLPISISLGPTGKCGRVLGIGESEGTGHCVVRLDSYDQAGNWSWQYFYLNVDLTSPEAK